MRGSVGLLAVAVVLGAVGGLAPSAAVHGVVDSAKCDTLARGDANGDGRSDPVIPVPGKHGNAGQAVAFAGSSTGIVPKQVLRAGLDGLPGASTQGDSFGEEVASGDANGDECGDVAILAPYTETKRTIPGVDERGAITVVYGKKGVGYDTRHTQLITAASLHLPKQTVPGAGNHGLVRMISSPVFGDFVGENRDFLAFVETTYETGIGDQATAPEVVDIVIVQSTAHGLTLSSGSVLHGTAPSLTSGKDGTFAGSGVSLAAGRLHGNYPASLAVVVQGAGSRPTDPKHGDVTTHGVVDVLQGGSHFPNEGTQVWDRESDGVPGTDSGNVASHLQATWGDFDGDGFDDLAFSDDEQGVVTVLYSDGGVLDTIGAQSFTAGEGGVPASSGFGRVLAAGDFNGDSDDELAVSSDDGSITVLPGTHAHGLVTLNPRHWTQATTGVPGARESGSAFGDRLTVGWFGRGLGQDLLVSDETANDGAGSVTEFFGARSPNVGLGLAHATLFTEATPGVPGVEIAGDRFGG